MPKLEKRRNVNRAIQWITFALSIVFATLPGIVTAFRVAPSVEGAAPKIGLAGYAVFLVAVGILIVLHSLGKTFAHKLPWATIACVVSWILLFLLISLQNIIDQAVIISGAFALGCTIAFVLSSASLIFKAVADICDDELKRRETK